MRQFLDLIRDIRDNGIRKINRTGVDTIGVIGRQLRFDLREGFPLSTTRPIYVRALIHELLFFLRGDTNNTHLNDVGVHIWDQWAVKDDITHVLTLTNYDRACLYATAAGIAVNEAIAILDHHDKAAREVPDQPSGEQFLDAAGIPRTRERVIVAKGELGPVYGKCWREWRLSDGGVIDQMAVAIKQLRTNPFSRRILVSAWNPEVLPDESRSPQENAARGLQCLAPCHTFFKLSVLPHPEGSEKTTRGVLYLHLFQRSLDCIIGGPYNVASYSLLLAMLAQITNLEAGEFIWTIDDAHLYVDQLELVEEELSREPTPLPKLWLSPLVREIDDFKFEDIKIYDYFPVKPQIPYPVAV